MICFRADFFDDNTNEADNIEIVNLTSIKFNKYHKIWEGYYSRSNNSYIHDQSKEKIPKQICIFI